MKIKYYLSIGAIFLAMGGVVAYTHYKNEQKKKAFIMENIEALSDNENGGGNIHGEIDDTLERYQRLSSKKVVIEEFVTEVPCCEHVDSKFSACSKGLDRC